MEIKKQLDIKIVDSNTTYSFYDYINAKTELSTKLHNKLIGVYNDRYYKRAVHSKNLTYRLFSKLLDKIEYDISSGGSKIIRANITIQKHLGSDIVIFAPLPYYDVQDKIVYLFKNSIAVDGLTLSGGSYKKAINLLLNNSGNLSTKVYRVIEIDISRFKYRLKEI